MTKTHNKKQVGGANREEHVVNEKITETEKVKENIRYI